MALAMVKADEQLGDASFLLRPLVKSGDSALVILCEKMGMIVFSVYAVKYIPTKNKVYLVLHITHLWYYLKAWLYAYLHLNILK